MRRIPSGAQTYSKTRFPPNAPRWAVSASGPYVTCSDGRTYVDAVAALGPIMLGHRWPAVEDAALAQARKGQSFSLPTEIEETLAERLCTLVPGMDMMRIGKNGNDVVNAAVRIARAVTGKETVLAEEGAYHGHADWALAAPKDGGIKPYAGFGVRRFQRGDVEQIRKQISGAAAVLLDPIPAHDPSEQGKIYYAQIRKLCDEHGALLILDEMVTGFRAGYPGAVTSYSIKPDLWCGAKALGNGWPITVLLGKRDYMERIEQDVFYSTTFAGEAVSIAAALACLDEMERIDATALVNSMGTALREWYSSQAIYMGLGHFTKIVGYSSRPIFKWTVPDMEAAFLAGVIEGGMLCQGYINLMVSHKEAWGQILGSLTLGLEAAAQIPVPQPAA